MVRLLLVVAWWVGVLSTARAACYGVSAQPWLIAVVWGLPIGWAVAWRIRRLDPLVDDDLPPLLHSLMLTSTDDDNAMHGFNALVAQAIAAIVILVGTIGADYLEYDFSWDCGLITLGACMLAQYYDLHFSSSKPQVVDSGQSAGPDETF